MATNTFPLKYRRKSSPPPSPRMLSPIAQISSSFPTNFISPPPKWLDSDDELEHEPALTSDDALTVFSSSCSRAPSLAPLDAEDAHVDILSSPVQEAFIRPSAPSRAPLSRYNNKSYPPNAKSPTTREDVAAVLLSLRAQPRLGPSQPVLVQLPSPTESVEPPLPVRRSRVVSPSLRNLVLPRTPSPSPRRPLQTISPVIDSEVVHGTTPSAQRTPSRRATPASSPLPPSSPFAEEDDYESSELSRFHSVPCPKPKPAPLQVHITTDDSELDGHTRVQSHDDQELEEDCDRTGLCEAVPAAFLEDSLFPENGPDERLDQSCVPLLPLPVIEIPPRSLDRHKSPLLTPCELSATELPNGCRPDTPISVAPPPLKLVLPALHIDSSLPDVVDQETPAKPLAYSRAASSPLTTLDEPSIPPSPVHSVYPASSPLSSPPLSPTCEQQQKQQEREYEHALPLPSPVVGIKRPASVAPEDTDGTVVDTASISGSASAPLARTHARTKRRRREVDSDDKLWRNLKKHNPIPIPEPPASAPTSSTRPTSPPHVSSSTTTTTAAAAACPTTSFSSSTDDPNPDEADEKETEDSDDFPICPINDDDTGPPDPSHPHHSHPSPHHHPPHHQPEKEREKVKEEDQDQDQDQDQEQTCPHPALLGILLETLALSRASSLPLTALTRTTPALATCPHAELTSTLAWAVRARILGCVRSSGEALPPSYFYDPAADPDRERRELLQCLMPRAGKRRETMKYKQYYWAPVVVGRGRTRTWDVDWEE